MIFHDKVRDRYIVRVGFREADGKTKRKSRIAYSMKDAQKLESRMRLEASTKVKDASSFTLDMLWIEFEQYSKERTKRTTFESYSFKYSKYIKGYFGDRPVDELTVDDFRKWKASIPEDHSFSHKHQVYTVLHMILRYGYKAHGCTGIHGLEMAGDFKKDPNTALMEEGDDLHYWTPDQFFVFSSALRKKADSHHPYEHDYLVYWSSYVLFNILFYAGLRRGEANALYVSDFHEGSQSYLSITKSVTHKVNGGGWILTGPKNKSSVRKVPIPSALVQVLKEHILRLSHLPAGIKKDTYLVGGVYPLNDSSSDVIKERIEKEEMLPHIRVHDFRHSYVSVLINAGTPITTISKLVGHSSTEMTWKVYSHLYPLTLSTAVNVFDALPGNKPPSFTDFKK